MDLKLCEGVMSQEIQAVSRNLEKQGNGFSPRTFRKKGYIPDALIFSPVRLVLDF